MDIRCKVWLEKDGEMLFGKGRALLLSAIEEAGSLAGAAKRLGMSYRAAWGKLKASEEHLAMKLVEPSPSGHHGMQLTAQGRLMLKEFERLLKEAEAFFSRRLARFHLAPAPKATPKKATPRAGTRGATKSKA
jgi:molybdate transport system regulatory protein